MCGTIGTVNGRDNVTAMIGTFIAALPDPKATEQVVVAEGDYVFVWGLPGRLADPCTGARCGAPG
jgi:hypothetical protein